MEIPAREDLDLRRIWIMCRGLLSVLFAICSIALLPAAAPAQSGGGSQLVRAKGGEFTLRLPAAWKTKVEGDVLFSGDGDQVWAMSLTFTGKEGDLSRPMGLVTEDTKKLLHDVTWEDEKATVGGGQALVRVFHGVTVKGVEAARRIVFFNPAPSGPGDHTYRFLFDLAKGDYARWLPVFQWIEQSFRVGSNPPAPATPCPGPLPAVTARPAPAPPAPVAGKP